MASSAHRYSQQSCQPYISIHDSTEQHCNAAIVEEEVIFGIDMKTSGDLGCAYYTPSADCLSIFEDVAAADAKVIESLLIHAQPSIVIANNKASETLLEYLDSHSKTIDSGTAVSSPANLRCNRTK